MDGGTGAAARSQTGLFHSCLTGLVLPQIEVLPLPFGCEEWQAGDGSGSNCFSGRRGEIGAEGLVSWPEGCHVPWESWLRTMHVVSSAHAAPPARFQLTTETCDV